MIEKPKYLAVLATDREVQENGIGEQSIFLNRYQIAQFSLRLISDCGENGVWSDVPAFVNGFMNRIEQLQDPGGEPEERVDYVRRSLQNRFLRISYQVNQTGYYNITGMEIGDGELYRQFYREGRKLRAVPVYEYYGLDGFFSSVEAFLNYILEKRELSRVPDFDVEHARIRYLIYEDTRTDTYYAIGNSAGGLFSEGLDIRFRGDGLCYTEFQEEWYDECFQFEPGKDRVLFVTPELDEKILTALSTSKTHRGESSQPVFDGGGTLLAERFAEVFNAEFPEETEEQRRRAKREELLGEATALEKSFLQYFFELTRRQGLYYSQKDLLNFHISMKTGSLIILSGMSGTGKSRLVSCYAEALGLLNEETGRFLMIPVQPSWADDGDLIGFMDMLHGKYRPAETGLVQLLAEAARPENQEKMYLVLFDEMNLARVEHYFSRFLSICEMPEEKRLLRLYDPVFREEGEKALFPPVLKVGRNVRFVGTVNTDETTYHFSDKVLDRANVIELEVLPFREWGDRKNETGNGRALPMKVPFYLYDAFCREEGELSAEELAFLWELHQRYNENNAMLGIGPRIVRQIATFLNNLPEDSSLTRREAFDLQVNQRILTKLRGPEELVSSVLSGSEGKGLKDLLNRYKGISDFTVVRETIRHKEQELKIYGFAL